MTSETARIEAFSDGVYAIAITLLILDLTLLLGGVGDSQSPGELSRLPVSKQEYKLEN